jgi:hypothetical protein
MNALLLRASLPIALATFVACGNSTASSSSTSEPKPPAGEPDEEIDANGCVVPGSPVRPDQICVRTLKASVTDLSGAPIPNLITTACGDGCTFGKTDTSGVTKMTVRRYMSQAALMLHGRSRYASYYARFEGGGDVDKGVLPLPSMPIDQAVAFPESTAAVSSVSFGDVTFTFAAGAEVKIDRVELDEPELQRFSAVSVPLDKLPPFAAEAGGGFAAVYAFTPYATRITPAAAVKIANTGKLPSGAAVELFAQATLLDDRNGPFGKFNKLAEGHVSADGATITTDEGQGIPEITWLGVRAKPSTR